MLQSILTIGVTIRDNTSGKYLIKILKFEPGTEDLFQKSLVGQNVTTSPHMYKCMERVLKGDPKAEFLQHANLIGSCTVANFTTVMATMTVLVFLALIVIKDNTCKGI